MRNKEFSFLKLITIPLVTFVCLIGIVGFILNRGCACTPDNAVESTDNREAVTTTAPRPASFKVVETASAQKIRVTYITESKGFKHSVLPESEKIMQDIGAKNGFDVSISQESAKVITAENLKNIDVLIFYTTGELPWAVEQKKLFLDFVRNGKGFIGIHSATDTFYQWPEYGELIGGYFDGHPWGSNDKVAVKKDDKSFSLTKQFEDSFEWVEETYQYKQFNVKECKVVMSLDITKTNLTKKGVKGIYAVEGNANIKSDSFPLVWYRTYGKGRVFYSEPGHNPSVWNDSRYQTMITNAIKWAAKKLK